MRIRNQYHHLLVFLLVLLPAAFLVPATANYNLDPHQLPQVDKHNSIPRSTHSGVYQRLRQAATSHDQDVELEPKQQQALLDRPPWNPSPHIDATGFLKQEYGRIPGDWETEVKLGGRYQNQQALIQVKARIRQVPGDGNCLFHSISTCMAYVVNGTHVDFSTPAGLNWLYHHSNQLRQQAVESLRKRKVLFLQGKEYLRAHDLVQAAAAQYGISAEHYCDLMQQDGYWGGGPEVVALCNVLKRPIHVYELAAEHPKSATFVLRRMACFGSPKYDGKQPFHILSADSRFPNIAPGKQLPSGNHFLAVFPLDQPMGRNKFNKDKLLRKKKKRKHQVRGGGVVDDATNHGSWGDSKRSKFFQSRASSADTNEDDRQAASDDEASLVEMESMRSSLKSWWKRFFLLNKADEDEG